MNQPWSTPPSAERSSLPIPAALSSFLDAARWMAAALVVLSHSRHLLLKDYGSISDHSPAIKLLYFLTGFGSEAVVVFFVVSGFLVGGLTLEKWARQGVALKSYALARIARIYTVFLPALVISGLLDLWGANAVDASQLYADPRQYHTILLQQPISDSLGISVFLGNLAMLQKTEVPVFGSNGPLWSLAYEWWYYVMFAIVAAVALQPSPWRVVVGALLFIGCAWLLPSKLLWMGLLWLAGLAVFHLIRAGWRCPRWPALLLFMAALAWSRLWHNPDNVDHPEGLASVMVRDGVVALGFCIALLGASSWRFSPRAAALHVRLASFSYSLYLVHFPMLVFLAAAMAQWGGVAFCAAPTLGSVAYWLVMTAALVAYGWTFAQLTERHTAGVRHALERAWSLITQGFKPRHCVAECPSRL